MKQVSIFIIGILAALTVYSQQKMNVSVTGIKNLQVSLDGREFNLNTGAAIKGNSTTISINDLDTGRHILQVIRTDQNTNRPDIISTIVHLRHGYDMQVRVNANGSLEFIEKMQAGAYQNMMPMSNTNFNTLLKNVRSQKSNTAKENMLSRAFNTAQNHFTSSQARQLISQVTSENSRIQLAKLAYPIITDKPNFYLVYDLIKSQNGRNEMEDFVYYYGGGTPAGNAMSDANFNSLYQTIRQQWPASVQMNSLTNAFNNTANYFTTYQASRLIQLVSAESNRLQLAKLSYRAIVDRNNFNQIYDLLGSQSSRNELQAYVNNYNAGSDTGNAMSDANFNSLYQTIREQWPVSTQMNSLTNAFNNTANHFTSYQASRLIQLVSAESNRLQLAKLSYRAIVDRHNFSQIYELFSSQSSKDDLAAYVKNYGSGSDSRVPMSDADFNALYQSIQMQFFPNERMNSLTEVFNKIGYFFTSAQAKQLIQLVSFESNRLQLAKLSYRSITDRHNFSQLYDLLSSQASRNELDAYVKAYKE